MDSSFDTQLFECSFLIVSLLLDKYKDNQISRTDFKKHTINKIIYLQKNLTQVNDQQKRKEIERLINECIVINSMLN